MIIIGLMILIPLLSITSESAYSVYAMLQHFDIPGIRKSKEKL